MKSFIIKSGLITGFVILIMITSGIGLGVLAPLHPGNILFPIQHFAEQQLRMTYTEPVQKASYMLDLVDRRINDLSFRTGTKYELIALEYLDKALDQAIEEISALQPGQTNDIQARFNLIIIRTQEVINLLLLIPVNNQDAINAFRARINSLIEMAQPEDQSISTNKPDVSGMTGGQIKNSNSSLSSISGRKGLIPFPPGTKGAVHAFYPLIGQHASLDCNSCHENGRYLGTANACISCHILEKPVPHYDAKCDLCHTPVSWSEINFDHDAANSIDCESCHLSEKPANHYSGQCSACHVIQAWNIVSFNHEVAGAFDCVSCHSEKAPINHYNGQCSNCHITSDWKSVDFNHNGFSECSTCHSNDTPGNHYNGQCSLCHSTDTWQGATFNHAGLNDCSSCHSGDAPAGHYSGQCSNCHNPDNGWANASFNHSGFTDCVSCHAGDAPGDHFPGQCSDCHNTNGWGGAIINHNNLTDCVSCHLKDRPKEHDAGECSQCHRYPHWGD